MTADFEVSRCWRVRDSTGAGYLYCRSEVQFVLARGILRISQPLELSAGTSGFRAAFCRGSCAAIKQSQATATESGATAAGMDLRWLYAWRIKRGELRIAQTSRGRWMRFQ